MSYININIYIIFIYFLYFVSYHVSKFKHKTKTKSGLCIFVSYIQNTNTKFLYYFISCDKLWSLIIRSILKILDKNTSCIMKFLQKSWHSLIRVIYLSHGLPSRLHVCNMHTEWDNLNYLWPLIERIKLG